MAVAGARAVVTAQQKVTSAQSSCPSFTGSPLKRSFFSAKFLATPPNSIHSIYVADGVKLVDWPVEEMRDFLGTQRQWGQYILRDDKLCRQVVAVFYTAYDQVVDKSAEPRVNPMDLLPFAGEHKPLVVMGDVDWIAPHLMNTLVGMIVEHGYVPERSARVLNALIDPQRSRRLAVQVGFVLLLNAVMWLIFCIDYIHTQIGKDDGQTAGGANATTGGNATAVIETNTTAPGNSTNSTGSANSTGQDLSGFEWVYPSAPWPIYMHGVYPRQTQGLKGIPAMCFLHYTVAQLGVNSFGFVLFGAILIVKHGGRIFAMLSIWLWFFAGFGTWVIGRDQNHIGCSGMIYGYFAYILLIGILKLLGCPPRCNNVVCTLDSTQDILIACALIALYTGILYGVLPKSGSSKAGIEALELTWEIDLMGWLGGTLFAAALAIHLRKSAAFKKSPGHGNKAPKAGKRFTTATAAGATAAMSSTPSPFGAPGSTELSDNPFLAHLPQQPPPRDAGFEQNYAPVQPPPPLPAAPPDQTSYV